MPIDQESNFTIRTPKPIPLLELLLIAATTGFIVIVLITR